jgi:hypothetical protein
MEARLRFSTAFVLAALCSAASLAFASGLPGAAQDVASEMLAKVGVTVPGPNSNAGDHPTVRGRSADAPIANVTEPSEDASSSGKGAEVSELATTTDLTGVEKGAAISTLASGGKSQAGQNGQATEEDGGSAAGQATAATASNGHSTAGSANSATGQSHRP